MQAKNNITYQVIATYVGSYDPSMEAILLDLAGSENDGRDDKFHCVDLIWNVHSFAECSTLLNRLRTLREVGVLYRLKTE